MLFYVQMKWNYQGRISQEQLWQMETVEGEHGMEGVRSGLVKGLYKVVSQHRIVAIVDVASLEDLDRNSMGWLPMREYLDFEVVWALRDYEGFLEDVHQRFPLPGTAGYAGSGGVSSGTRATAERWFSSLKAGRGQDALACLANDIVWVNNPPDKGLSDIVPWLGEFHGIDAVKQSFVIWGQLSEVKNFELRKLVVDGDEVFAVVHEVATIKATGLNYDIEFIQRFRVKDDRIVFWKSYWDTVKGIIPFRGDMVARLVAAARENNLTEAMLVLPFGADPNTVDSVSGLSVLMIAACRGHIEMVKALLQASANPNWVDRKSGSSALHKACQGGHFEIVQLLVTAGAFVDLQAATTGHTPLVEAIWFKSDVIVELLLDRNARLEPKTYYGFTLDQHVEFAGKVTTSAEDRQRLERIALLIAARRQRDQQLTAAQELNSAVLAGDVGAVRRMLAQSGSGASALLDQRLPVTGSYSDGHTPLLIAARDGHTEIVRVLIAAGADVNATDPIFGAMPLHKATYNGHKEITDLLTHTVGIQLNYQGPSNGYTPLHDALWHAFADCAEILVDAGAGLDIEGWDGKRPSDLAIEKLGNNHPLTIKLKNLCPPSNSPTTQG